MAPEEDPGAPPGMSLRESPNPNPNALLDPTTGSATEGGALLPGKFIAGIVNRQCVHLIITVPTVHVPIMGE